MTNSGFDSQRDAEIIEVGGFFCQSCLAGKPLDDQSPDPGYCLGCYAFLVGELELLPAGKRAKWMPKPVKALPQPLSQPEQAPVREEGCDKTNTVVISSPVVGRPPMVLPADKIRDLAAQGLSCRAIAQKLEAEGFAVSYRTIQRVLSGQRILV